MRPAAPMTTLLKDKRIERYTCRYIPDLQRHLVHTVVALHPARTCAVGGGPPQGWTPPGGEALLGAAAPVLSVPMRHRDHRTGEVRVALAFQCPRHARMMATTCTQAAAAQESLGGADSMCCAPQLHSIAVPAASLAAHAARMNLPLVIVLGGADAANECAADWLEVCFVPVRRRAGAYIVVRPSS